MTDREFTELFVILDQVWGGLDVGREAGYRAVLEDFDGDVVAQAVGQMTQEDRTWLPKAPEIAARCHRLLHERAQQQHVEQLLARVRARLKYEDELAALVERVGDK